ncbi:MAG: carboxymuconolactone decarboxylase family protein [Rhodocyclaceae bacterium]|nr:carboxymuconolactone decarboxylase family protein [Rhodocyclaceae bacterium]
MNGCVSNDYWQHDKVESSHPFNLRSHPWPICPLPRESVPEFKARFDHYAATRGFVPNSILTMSRRPAIARAFMDLNKAVLYEGTVPEELKMLLSLIASQAAGCRYCQAHMANLSGIYKASDKKSLRCGNSRPATCSATPTVALRLALHPSLPPNEASGGRFRGAEAPFRRRPDRRDRRYRRAVRLPPTAGTTPWPPTSRRIRRKWPSARWEKRAGKPAHGAA